MRHVIEQSIYYTSSFHGSAGERYEIVHGGGD